MSIIAQLASAPKSRIVDVGGLAFEIHRIESSAQVADTGIPILVADRRSQEFGGGSPDASFQDRYRDALICASVCAAGRSGHALEPLRVFAYGPSDAAQARLSVHDLPLGIRTRLAQEIAMLSGFGAEVPLGEGTFPAGGPADPGQAGAEVRD